MDDAQKKTLEGAQGGEGQKIQERKRNKSIGRGLGMNKIVTSFHRKLTFCRGLDEDLRNYISVYETLYNMLDLSES